MYDRRMRRQAYPDLRRLLAALVALLTLAGQVSLTAPNPGPVQSLAWDSGDDNADDADDVQSAWVPGGGDLRLVPPIARFSCVDQPPTETPAPPCRRTAARAPPA